MGENEIARRAIERHCTLFSTGDRAGWLANFTEEPTLEEPVGTDVRRGRQPLEELFDNFGAMGVKVALNPAEVIVNWPEAAAWIEITLETSLGRKNLCAIEIFTLADDGRVAAIRTFVDPEALTSALSDGP